jgi:hypothetical protein
MRRKGHWELSLVQLCPIRSTEKGGVRILIMRLPTRTQRLTDDPRIPSQMRTTNMILKPC